MELAVLIPVVLLMSGAAIAMALKERPLPAPASAAFIAAASSVRSSKPSAGEQGAGKAANFDAAVVDADTAETADDSEGSNKMNSMFSQTDVLLADALTEMIGLKAEIYRLRGRVDNLNTEVARLSGNHLRPVPPATSKRPVPIRKAA